jgi:DNA-directed RNA polymerase subunit RPC12/RpoP
MRGIKVLSAFIAIILMILGVVFLIAAFSDHAKTFSRLMIGGLLVITAVVLLLLGRMRTEQITHTIEQKIDLSGDVALEMLKCTNCGGTLSKKNVEVRAGAVMVNCPYCGSTYQIKEAPKW